MMDLADYLQAEVGRTSIRKVAKATGVSKTTIDNIVNRRLKTMPDVATLEKIARAYGMTLPVVVEMAGAALGDLASSRCRSEGSDRSVLTMGNRRLRA